MHGCDTPCLAFREGLAARYACVSGVAAPRIEKSGVFFDQRRCEFAFEFTLVQLGKAADGHDRQPVRCADAVGGLHGPHEGAGVHIVEGNCSQAVRQQLGLMMPGVVEWNIRAPQKPTLSIPLSLAVPNQKHWRGALFADRVEVKGVAEWGHHELNRNPGRDFAGRMLRMRTMSDRKKGFDPLSSLFDAPDPGDVLQDASPSGHALTQPGRPAPRPETFSGIEAGLDLEDAPTEMAPAPEPSPAAGKAEVGGAGPLRSRPSGSADVEFIGDLPASDDWTESKPEALFALNQLPSPEPDEGPAPRYGQKMSRLERLAARAVRPISALDAAREAASMEAAAEERASQTLTDRIQSLIVASLPGVGDIDVKAAKVADERDVLSALWKSHRSKFLSDGELERAVAAARVVDHLKNSPSGALIAAHAVTAASDYLVWIDLQSGSLVAAFADARAYFAG